MHLTSLRRRFSGLHRQRPSWILPSALPDSLMGLAVELDRDDLNRETAESLTLFQRAANYIATAMLFLHHNVFLERDLTFDDIKPRLLGHWGTCPGLTLIYSHLNLLITESGIDMFLVTGPGHGAPGVLACLWLEGSLERFYPQFSQTRAGLLALIRAFSTPGGLPSHINASTPGAIHEGGELGYALSVSFGAVMDNPDLVVACVVGDGEAETGPTATAWHGYKYIDPKESGAVLPIVHVNGFKIAEPTIYGCMDNKELVALFSGYGYKCRIVEDMDHINSDLAASFKWALAEIRHIQRAAREGRAIIKPRWPVIILRSPKGWTGPKLVHGAVMEGSFNSHGIPLPKAKTDSDELGLLQDWLHSYSPEELFSPDGKINPKINRIVPSQAGKRMGQRVETYTNQVFFQVPDWEKYAKPRFSLESAVGASSPLIDEWLQLNPNTTRIMSPDELASNKLASCLQHTGRNFQWYEETRNKGGRVIEILSEHTCQGFLQGYILTGRSGIFPSYESFLGIVHTMMVQYGKFIKEALEIPWRIKLPSLTYIETSTWARQEHNGFSHQNPCFIGAVLNVKPTAARVYLPPDANCFLSTTAHCLRSRGYINLIVGSKQPLPVWLDAAEAAAHCRKGCSIWKFASTDGGEDPDVVLVGLGAELTFEILAGLALLRRLAPELRIRVVNVTDLMVLQLDTAHPHGLEPEDFVEIFTWDRPCLFFYPGYATELQGLLFGRPNLDRVTVSGYREEGTTTTPFDMLRRNNLSRFDVAEWAVKRATWSNGMIREREEELVHTIRTMLKTVEDYILDNARDPEGTFEMPKLSLVTEQSKFSENPTENGHVCAETK